MLIVGKYLEQQCHALIVNVLLSGSQLLLVDAEMARLMLVSNAMTEILSVVTDVQQLACKKQHAATE